MEPPQPPPDTSLLHAPVRKGWGKRKWELWREADAVHRREYSGGRNFNQYMQQRRGAVQWAAPDKVTLKLSISSPEEGARVLGEIQLSKEGNDTWRSVIDKFCAAEGIDRDRYFWVMADYRSTGPDISSVLCQKDTECFNIIWNPQVHYSRFSDDGTTYTAHLIGRKKSPPPSRPPAGEPPSFAELNSPPPEGDAPLEEWEAWHRNNTSGRPNSPTFWFAMDKAIKYRCPHKCTISLKGISHEQTLAEFDADTPFSVAVASYCAAAPNGNILPSEVLLKYIDEDEEGDEYIDPQMKTSRMFFTGYGSVFNFEIVYRNEDRTRTELQATRPVSHEYHQFRGSAYFLSETEQPWFVTKKNGIETYNKIWDEALMLYNSDNCYEPDYDAALHWFEMTEKVNQMLTNIVKKPRGGWSAGKIAESIDRLTAALLVLKRGSDWTRDYKGRHGCLEEEGVDILRNMDKCAAKIILASSRMAPTAQLGLDDSLAQLKRLMTKYKEDPTFSSSDECDDYEVFSKALGLV